MVDQSIRRVHNRGLSGVLVDVAGVHVNVLNAHLDWYDTGTRTAQLENFMWVKACDTTGARGQHK